MSESLNPPDATYYAPPTTTQQPQPHRGGYMTQQLSSTLLNSEQVTKTPENVSKDSPMRAEEFVDWFSTTTLQYPENREAFIQHIKARDEAIRNAALEEVADTLERYCDGNGCDFAEIIRNLKTTRETT